jgi:eukaryotic-like serine/threonine-protein kinase
MDDRERWEMRVGSTLRGKWRLESVLGAGGMAAVYVGVNPIGRRDAIKILHPEVARQKDLRARFEQEARVLNRFRHPGAVEVLDMDMAEDGSPFLVMELLEGEALSARAKQVERFPVQEMLQYVDEVLDVLAAAHAQGIVHRDIKLDNIFVTRAGHVKVLDFGVAHLRDSKSVQTKFGSMLGTLPYMPPEQIRGLEVDGRADLFSVGAMMFRLLTKRRIHDVNTEAAMLVKMTTEPAPPVGPLAPGTPTPICMVVDRALAFWRERRYPDAQTMQQDVRAVMRGEQPPFAMARLAAGDLPNTLLPPTAPAQPVPQAPPARVSLDDFRERQTAPPRAAPADEFRERQTAPPRAAPADAASARVDVRMSEASPYEVVGHPGALTAAQAGAAHLPNVHGATAYGATAYGATAVTSPPSTPPSGRASAPVIRVTPPPVAAGTMAYAPTMVASAEAAVAAVARPDSSPAIARSVESAPPAQRISAPAITPAVAPPVTASAPPSRGHPATSNLAIEVPSHLKDAKTNPAARGAERKFPVGPVIIATVFVVLLFVGVALLRSPDEDPSRTNRPAETGAVENAGATAPASAPAASPSAEPSSAAPPPASAEPAAAPSGDAPPSENQAGPAEEAQKAAPPPPAPAQRSSPPSKKPKRKSPRYYRIF